MTATELKEKLNGYIEVADDSLLRMLLTVARMYKDEDYFEGFSEEELKELDRDRIVYLSEERKVYSWEELKVMIKSGRGISG